MRRLFPILLAGLLACSVNDAVAAPQENVPPAHQQKNQVPETHQNADYLEPQPNNNGTKASADQQGHSQKPAKAGNMEKSKRFHEPPEDGGTGVKQP